MTNPFNQPFRNEAAGDIHLKLRWLMLARVVFTLFLLLATIVVQYQHEARSHAGPITFLYFFVAAIFVLSLLYALIAKRIVHQALFAYFQIGVDTFIVTLIVYITGGFFSFFSFLYLVIATYASTILLFKGGIIIALWSNFQYGLLLGLQYAALLPFVSNGDPSVLSGFTPMQMIVKVLITTIASLAVAVLSGLLMEQNQKTKKELRAMEAHVKRVEKIASIGEMAAGLAHEIRNPLASLVGSIQMLKEELPYNADHQRLMEIVSREADRLSSLVTEFLSFARPPAGKPKIFNLPEAVEEICELFLKDTQLSGQIVLEKDLSADMYTIMDPTHLRQVLWNLLINAAEALEDDHGRIAISCRPIKNNEIQITVADNGCGIASHEVQSIFNPFFTTKSEGTGLGLSIIHRILEVYDSRLDVDSQVSVGTTFSFILNRAKNPIA